jgi:hypothetical protein
LLLCVPIFISLIIFLLEQLTHAIAATINHGILDK